MRKGRSCSRQRFACDALYSRPLTQRASVRRGRKGPSGLCKRQDCDHGRITVPTQRSETVRRLLPGVALHCACYCSYSCSFETFTTTGPLRGGIRAIDPTTSLLL